MTAYCWAVSLLRSSSSEGFAYRDQSGAFFFVMGCGGGGYAYMTKKLLAHLGWDEELLYNMGAIATYAGARRVQVLEAAADGTEMWATWRLDAPQIDLSRMTPTA